MRSLGRSTGSSARRWLHHSRIAGQQRAEQVSHVRCDGQARSPKDRPRTAPRDRHALKIGRHALQIALRSTQRLHRRSSRLGWQCAHEWSQVDQTVWQCIGRRGHPRLQASRLCPIHAQRRGRCRRRRLFAQAQPSAFPVPVLLVADLLHAKRPCSACAVVAAARGSAAPPPSARREAREPRGGQDPADVPSSLAKLYNAATTHISRFYERRPQGISRSEDLSLQATHTTQAGVACTGSGGVST